jgi:uncharacterized protein YndB with AHSA1/START domain
MNPISDVEHLGEASPCDIVNQRVIPFTQEETFQAYANPDRLARWWGPNGFTNTFEVFEFQQGGNWKFVMRGPDGKSYDNECVFRTISPHQRIVIEHTCAPHFVLTVTLDKVSAQETRIFWRQRFDTPEIRDNLAKLCQGFNEQNFDRMVAELRTGH